MRAILFEKAGKDSIYLGVAKSLSDTQIDDLLITIRTHISKYSNTKCKTHRPLFKLSERLFGYDEISCRRGLTNLFMTCKFKLVEILDNNYSYPNSININIRGEMYSIPIIYKASIDNLKEELYPYVNESEDILWSIIEKYMRLDNYSALNVHALVDSLYNKDYKIKFIEEDDSDIQDDHSLGDNKNARVFKIYEVAAVGLLDSMRLYRLSSDIYSDDIAFKALLHIDSFAKIIADIYNTLHKKEEDI